MPPFRSLRSLRFKLTALATAVAAGVLAATAVALVGVQQRQLSANLDASLQARADTLAAAFMGDLPPGAITTGDEDRAIQLVADDGTVLVASVNLSDSPPLINRLEPDVKQAIANRDDLPLDDDAYRVLSRRIETAAGPSVLHVAENIDDFNEALAGLRATLAGTLPVVVSLLAALIWWLTGRTLAPVETIRREVDAITATNSGQRIAATNNDDEIGLLATTMNRMLDRLDDASARQRRFVADAAHELRTPLTRIRADVEVDMAQPERADPDATNHAVRTEIIGLEQLIDDLLHLARSNAGHHTYDHRPLDLDDIVLSEIERQRAVTTRSIDASGVSAAHMDGDIDQLARAVRNLLANATQHATDTVIVTLVESDDHVEFAVADDGPGVAAEHRNRIFERFARVDDARSRTNGGTGLGLAIANDIIQRHGGTIIYDPTWSNGARFAVTLPRR